MLLNIYIVTFPSIKYATLASLPSLLFPSPFLLASSVHPFIPYLSLSSFAASPLSNSRTYTHAHAVSTHSACFSSPLLLCWPLPSNAVLALLLSLLLDQGPAPSCLHNKPHVASIPKIITYICPSKHTLIFKLYYSFFAIALLFCMDHSYMMLSFSWLFRDMGKNFHVKIMVGTNMCS